MLARSPDRVAKYLAAIGRLASLIAEHRASFDEARRLPEVVFNALADAGLFRLWLPAALGGPELSPAEFMIVVEAVSALDGSVGWLVANGSAMSRVAGYVARPVCRESGLEIPSFHRKFDGSRRRCAKGRRRLSRHGPVAIR